MAEQVLSTRCDTSMSETTDARQLLRYVWETLVSLVALITAFAIPLRIVLAPGVQPTVPGLGWGCDRAVRHRRVHPAANRDQAVDELVAAGSRRHRRPALWPNPGDPGRQPPSADQAGVRILRPSGLAPQDGHSPDVHAAGDLRPLAEPPGPLVGMRLDAPGGGLPPTLAPTPDTSAPSIGASPR